ncbi:MAG TPA: nucleotide exchange factor GrpE [Gemmataceae bacterium]|nr:nucleotide exchange factor GrpE [Gemmataceae bacterium]
MKRDVNREPINQVRGSASRDLSAAPSPDIVSPVNGTSADLHEKLEQLRARARERDQFLELLQRTRADFENYQKRVRREQEEERRYQHGPLALDLLPVLDNLERATAAAARAGDTGPLAQGVELVRTMFLDVLRRHGITPLNALGQPFDPDLHHALATKAVPDQPANTVVEVVKEGYRIHERLLRPAEVVVATPSGSHL